MLFVVLLSALGALLLGFLSPGDPWRGSAASFVLLLLSLSALRAAWLAAGRGRRLAILMTVAFLLRLGGGVALSLIYPHWGYAKPVYEAGYLFPDALDRDREAWQVAQSGEALLFNPNLRFASDQYGGLATLSALVYRTLSPDAHRPWLILILAAAAFTFGLPFLQRAALAGWDARVAATASLIYVFYPDGIFFTMAQMREPFLIGLSAVALWGTLRAAESLRAGLLPALGALALMALISYPAAAFVGVSLALLLWIGNSARPSAGGRLVLLAGLGLGALVMAALSWSFLREAAGWDAVLTESGSGMVAALLSQIPSWLAPPFITLYGVLRPLLPAAIFEPSIPLAKTIILLRSLGWYALLPLLVYAPLAVRHLSGITARLRGLWLTLLPWFWILLVSLRAGGDESDNPRYRLILFGMLCIAAAWAWHTARSKRDPWLGRILLVELLLLLAFSQWYAARYLHLLVKLPLMTMLAVSGALAAGVVLWGLVSDWRAKRLRR